MGAKFTSDDLFRIANENLSDVEFTEFRFRVIQSPFIEIFSAGSGDLGNIRPGKLSTGRVACSDLAR